MARTIFTIIFSCIYILTNAQYIDIPLRIDTCFHCHVNGIENESSHNGTYIYKYKHFDSKGNWVERDVFNSDDKFLRTQQRKITYSDN